MNLIDLHWISQNLHPRPLDAHKKTFGHVLIVAGSAGKAGAAILCARAALHAGCGMVTAMIPEEAVGALLQEGPEIMYTAHQDAKQLDLSKFDAIAIGPGLGFQQSSKDNLFHLIDKYKGPIVIDADALTLLSGHLNLLSEQHILTPHPGEFAKLRGVDYDLLKRQEQAIDFVSKYPATLVLKGVDTIVGSLKNGLMINTTGNDGMATAGSGDVLTGIIVALCAQNYSNYQAACIGVFVHGMAGDLAIQDKSKAGLVAGDLIEYLDQIRLLD